MLPEHTLLVLLSAALHPLWNALIKRDTRAEGAWISLTLLMVVLAGGHALAAGYDLASAAEVWPVIAMSWGGQLLYGTSLIITLRRGDLSAYYPIIRSSPLFIVGAGVLFMGQQYTWVLLGGVALVLLGAFLLQVRPGVRFLDDPKTLMFAVIAMSGTGIYSIADSRAMQVVEPPVLFFWVEVLCLPSYIVLFRLIGHPRASFGELFAWTRRPLKYIGIAVICYVSYSLILWVYRQGADVAAVTSVRQASIPLSVIIGGMWLKEKGVARRFGASMLLAAGIVTIVLAS